MPPTPDDAERDPHAPVRRSYSPPTGRRDVDRYEQTLKLKAAMWSAPGVLLGAMAGALMGHPVLGALGGGLSVYLTVNAIVGGAGRAAGTLHNPSGKSTPHAKEYSAAESLVVRGRYPEAVAAFEAHVAEDPEDPGPYLRLARIHRDQLADWAGAAAWFRRGLRDARMEPGIALLARRELIELYLRKSGEPMRAAPELARLADERPGTPEGEWAARELADLKERMRVAAEDDGTEGPAHR